MRLDAHALAGSRARGRLVAGLFLALLGGAIVFPGLGAGTLTGDEAMSANLSWNVARFGYPTAWDGRNLITNYNNGAEFNDQLVWTFHPWLSFYAGAASILLFGKTTFGVRCLYALAGLAALFLVHELARRVTAHGAFAALALLVAALSVPLLLLIRQAHYYAFVMLFTVWVAYEYVRFLERASWRRAGLLVVPLTLLFYTNTIFLLPVLGGLVLHYALLFRGPRRWREFSAVIVAVAALAAPWIVYAVLPTVAEADRVVGGFNHGAHGFVSNVSSLAWKFQTFTYPVLGLLALQGVLFVVSPRRSETPQPSPLRWEALLWVIVGLAVLQCALLWQHPWLPYRYALPAIVFGPILCAAHLRRILERRLLLGVACTVAVVATNGLAILPYSLLHYLRLPVRHLTLVVKSPYMFWDGEDSLYGYLTYFNRPRSGLLEYVRDAYSPFVGRTEAVVDYLRANATPEDAFVEEGVESEILVYHTGMRAANKLVPEERGFLKINGWFGLTQKNARKFQHLTAYPPERIRWIVSGNYFFPSEYRLLHAAEYVAVPLRAQDFYMNAAHDVDTWHRFHAWDGHVSAFCIYRRMEGR